MSIEPDTKDWTWVLERPCPECGFDATTLAATDVAARVRDSVPGYRAALARDDAAVRPDPSTWSALEYSCHVRDVHRLYTYRLGLMLEQDDPLFPNWDQDETAVADGYDQQDPAQVADELAEAAAALAARFAAPSTSVWWRSRPSPSSRPARRWPSFPRSPAAEA